ncbi:MAG TPA: helix-turn-helix domain-containing protein [Desulfosarcina sp.]|nr:helix-turn-helix domain-containing protein [Desulfosarcina sp.]
MIHVPPLRERVDDIPPENLPRRITAGSPPKGATPAAPDVDLDALKTERLVRALAATGGNQSEAARRLGISRTSVWSQINRHNIDPRKAAVRK